MFKIEPERSKKRKPHTTSSNPTHTISNLLSRARITGILIFLLSQPSHSVIRPTLLEKSGSCVEKSGRSTKSSSIPMKGDIDSLNASVACGILAYEIVRQRIAKGAKYEK